MSQNIELNSASAKSFLGQQNEISGHKLYFPIPVIQLLSPWWGLKKRMYSCLYFKCLQTRGRLVNTWNGFQKLYIKIDWFSNNF